MVARVLIGGVGVVVLVGACVLGAASFWLFSTFGGPDGVVQPLGRIESSASIIVIDVEDVQARMPFDIPGRVELALDAGDDTVTVVAGPTADVDRVIQGTSYDVARYAGAWSTLRVPGMSTAELGAGSWAVRASGDPAVIDVDGVMPGSVVIARDDPRSASVQVDLRYVVADARPIAMIGGAITVLLAMISLVLLWAATIGLRSRGRHA
jgi:hypothetical protein